MSCERTKPVSIWGRFWCAVVGLVFQKAVVMYFRLLQHAGIIKPELASNLQRMAGFRNIAVHDYQTMEVPILIQIIEEHLTDFLEFSQAVLRQGDTVPDFHP